MFAGKLAWSFLLIAVFITATSVTGWARNCSLETIKGTYVAFDQGTVVAPIVGFPPIPLPFLGVVSANPTYDGKGHLSGTLIASFGGYIQTGTFTGKYEVTPDCAYSDEVSPGPGVVFHHTGFITGEGILQEIHYIYSDAGTVISGTAKKQ